MIDAPSLDDLWHDRAEFKSEDPAFVAMSVNLQDPRGHSGGGKLSVDRLKNGDFIGVYRIGKDPFIYTSISKDGVNFYDERPIEKCSQWGSKLQDPCVLVFDLHGEEHIFVFSVTPRRMEHEDIGVNIAVFWSTDTKERKTWCSQRVPLIESPDIPDWGKWRFRGTSVPNAVMHLDRKHLWVYWTGMYEKDPNHADIGAGFIGCVDPANPSEFLSLVRGHFRTA